LLLLQFTAAFQLKQGNFLRICGNGMSTFRQASQERVKIVLFFPRFGGLSGI